MSDYLEQTLGIGEVAESCHVRLFPNPAHDMVAVELSTEYAATSQIALFDASGRQLVQHSFAGSTVYQFSIASLPAGIYLLRVTTPDGIATRQLVKR